MTAHTVSGPYGGTQWVVVTGASRGIGAATARALHAAGYGVVLWARDEERLSALADRLKPRERVRWACVDIGCPQQVARAAEASVPARAPLAGIVLNAGAGRWQSFADLAFEDWRRSLETNLSGAFLTLKALLPFLELARSPIIVGILSDSALTPFPNRAAYSSAKSGLQALLATFRREQRANGVRVCELYPSRVDTHFAGNHDTAGPGTRPEGLRAEDIAEVVRWIFEAPSRVEIRTLQLSSIFASFGLEEECLAYAE